jgi:bacterioferritin (cytochrome b1)
MSSIPAPLDPVAGILTPLDADPVPTVGDNVAVTPNAQSQIARLNALLRGEISASETYRMAIDKLVESSGEGKVDALRALQEDHVSATRSLRDRIRELGGEPDSSSGAWGVWAKFTMGAASLFGDVSALKGIKEGEEHGLKDYHAAIVELDPASAELVQNQLIPAQEKHLQRIDGLINAIDTDKR